MSNFSLQFPINSTSLGQCATNILFEIYTRGLNPNIFPIGNIDLSSFDGILEDGFNLWLKECITKSLSEYKSSEPSLRLWHINGSQESISKNNFLYSFIELDNITPTERNIINNHEGVFFPCDFNVKVCERCDAKNVEKIPLGFNYLAFKEEKVPKYENGEIVIGVVGKLEKRKNHPKVIKLLAEKFGGNSRYKIHLHVYNHFLHQDPNKCAQINQGLITQYCGGKIPFNFSLYGFFPKLTELNQCYNMIDLIIDGSGGESFSLPSFTLAALGKHAVVHCNSGIKEWANENNSFLVEPNGKIPAADGLFFPKEGQFNIGNIYDFDENEMAAKIDLAIEKINSGQKNKNGLELQSRFTWKKTCDQILDKMQI